MTNLLSVARIIVVLALGTACRTGMAEIWSGEDLYHTCAACHGVKGEGIAPLHAPKIAGLDARYLERQMNNYKVGIRGEHPGDLYGLQMVLFARTLGDAGEIERLSSYIASFPNSPAVETIQGNPGRGREVYKPCAVCHGHRGEGIEDFGAPRLAGMDDWYLASQLRNFQAGAIGYSDKDRFGKPHAAAIGNLLIDDASIMDVVAYINSLGTSDATRKQ